MWFSWGYTGRNHAQAKLHVWTGAEDVSKWKERGTMKNCFDSMILTVENVSIVNWYSYFSLNYEQKAGQANFVTLK